MTAAKAARAAAPNLARIPAGDFLMGAADTGEDERPVHRVVLSEFFIGRFPVTQDEYARFVCATGHPAPAVRILPLIAGGGRDARFHELAGPYVWHESRPPRGQRGHPVVLIRYDDALAYCQWLADELGRLVRLPTEAEWERAARGGVEGLRYPWGDDIDGSRCHFLSDRDEKGTHGTRLTGTFAPNGFGLYDVCGNVWEWVSDWYGADYYGAAR